MATSAAEAKQYWGYLIAADKAPTQKFEQLLQGIAHYISKHVAPWDVRALTPQKLAQFYKLVGGNYDALFLDCPSASLGFIYKSLGCFHSLEQDRDPFAAPSIPALRPAGFVRWQTVQLLLNPDEHVPILQEAVKRFEILNTGPGGPFPKILPVECLPKTPDIEMVKWHERVGERLRVESEATAARSAPPTSRNPNFRPIDLESVTDASFDSSSAIDAAEYFQNAPSSPKRPVYTKSVPIPSPNDRFVAPQSPHAGRRHSGYDPRSPEYGDVPTPTYAQPRPRNSPRRPKPVAVESASSSSSHSRSPPPRQRHAASHPRLRMSDPERSPRSQSVARNSGSPLRDEHGRRHSSHQIASYDRRDFMPQPVPPVPNVPSRASQTLSPPFFASQNGRLSNQVSPTGPTMPPSTQPASAPLPQGQFVNRTNDIRSKINYGSGPVDAWRSRLNPYVNGANTGPVPTPQAGGRRRSQSGGLDIGGREPPIEGVRFVEGVGGLDEEGRRGSAYEENRDGRRRRKDYEREWESERDDRRRDRRERRRSAGYDDP